MARKFVKCALAKAQCSLACTFLAKVCGPAFFIPTMILDSNAAYGALYCQCWWRVHGGSQDPGHPMCARRARVWSALGDLPFDCLGGVLSPTRMATTPPPRFFLTFLPCFCAAFACCEKDGDVVMSGCQLDTVLLWFRRVDFSGVDPWGVVRNPGVLSGQPSTLSFGVRIESFKRTWGQKREASARILQASSHASSKSSLQQLQLGLLNVPW